MIRRGLFFTHTILFLLIISILFIPYISWGYDLYFPQALRPIENQFFIDGESPETVLIGCSVECTLGNSDHFPPPTIQLTYSLSQMYLLPKTVLLISEKTITKTASIDFIWVRPTVLDPYRANFYYDFQLPPIGPGRNQLKTGVYFFQISVSSGGFDISPDNNLVESNYFQYIIFSGLLKFNQVQTTMTSVDVSDSTCSGDYLLTRVEGISHILGDEGFSASFLCVDSSDSGDGYSMDLSVLEGAAMLASVSGISGGFEFTLRVILLNSSGCQFYDALLKLPSSVSLHAEINGKIHPHGMDTIVLSGGSFTETVQGLELTCPTTDELFFHNYGLPFYVRASSVTFTAGNNATLILSNPVPHYVHEVVTDVTAFPDVVSEKDPRYNKGFPNNDIVFAKGLGTVGGPITITSTGISGIFNFGSGDKVQTSFPRAKITHEPWDVHIANGTIHEDTEFGFFDFTIDFKCTCPGGRCHGPGEPPDKWYYGDYSSHDLSSSSRASMLSNGAFGCQAREFMGDLEYGNSWGKWDESYTHRTFFRSDRGPGIEAIWNSNSIIVVPGFIMPDTASSKSIPQVLLGSFTFKDAYTLDELHHLNDPSDRYAHQGDGFFAGVNRGPELLVGDDPESPEITEGQGQILLDSIRIVFNGNSIPVEMEDREATKYVFRRGGLTGVFNTQLENRTITIYDYDIKFYRFSFRQVMNEVDDETFIDGELTLNGPVGGTEGMRVGFANLDLTCNGNLGEGEVDSEPEAQWPIPNEIDDDNDGRADEGCQVLSYWHMPILLTGMAFVNNPDDPASGECNTMPRQLEMVTRNKVDGIGTLLTITAHYPPDGTLHNQRISGTVDTRFDKPSQGNKPGFSLRLQKAYLNEVSTSIPGWEGFTVIAGYTDVPLFNDIRLSGHFINNEPYEFEDYDLFVFQDQTEDDSNHNGVPDGHAYGNVEAYRERLQSDLDEAPKPYFEYSWPRSGMINFNYYATYQPAIERDMPRFLGIKKNTNIVNVISLNSVADYISPERTKLSFGISADISKLQNTLVDVTTISTGLDRFLQTEIGVSSSFSLERKLEGLVHAESMMHDLTGGDITQHLGDVLDHALETGPIADSIADMVAGLNQSHQVFYQLMGALIDPLKTIQDEINEGFPSDLEFALTYSLYQYLAPFISYEPEMLMEVPGAPSNMATLLESFTILTKALNQFVGQLDQARQSIADLSQFLIGPVELIEGESTGMIDESINAIIEAQDLVDSLSEDIETKLSAFTEPSFSSNPLFDVLINGVKTIKDVRNAIAEVDLGLIADALTMAVLLSGSSMDTSLIQSAEDTFTTLLSQLDHVISQSESNLNSLANSLDLSALFNMTQYILNVIYHSLAELKTSLEELEYYTYLFFEQVDNNLAIVTGHFHALLDQMKNQKSEVPADWNTATIEGQMVLNLLAENLAHQSDNARGFLYALLEELEGRIFDTPVGRYVILSNYLSDIIRAPLSDILDDQGELMKELDSIRENVLSIIPNPSEADIRNMIRVPIMNTEAIEEINNIFYEQFGYISDEVDTISTQLTAQINLLIKNAIDAVQEELSEELKNIVKNIGENVNWTGFKAAKIDGFAIVSQDEVERLHLGAEFTMAGVPSNNTFGGVLDVTSWNAENGKGACDQGGGTGNVDAVISARNISADMLGMSVGLKETALGFTIAESTPKGVFGYVYLLGELGFETLALYDMGLEAGIGLFEVYLGATGAAHFEGFSIPKAAFFWGKSCDFEVLRRLDSEAADFIGEIEPLAGVFVRGSVEVPIWNLSCMLRVGVGADIGAWYFSNPNPGTYGGLLGGSAYGRLACLASLKGKVTLLGQKSGAQYKYRGDGWAACGVGWCSPSKWKCIRDARRDSWCLTADATYGATYDGSWHISGPDISCCH